jgi:hypothetical protein
MSYKYTYFDRTRRFLFRDLPNFFKNIWKFRKALWNHQWWDYSGTLDFIEIAVGDIANGIEKKGIEVEDSRMKKVAKMRRVVEIIKNIREDRYFDIVEKELGRGLYNNHFDFEPYDDEPDLYEIVDKSSEEEKKFNREFFERVAILEEMEWRELLEILKGQDLKRFDKEKDFDEEFDGSGLRSWWD